jgi:hypothetical protein
MLNRSAAKSNDGDGTEKELSTEKERSQDRPEDESEVEFVRSHQTGGQFKRQKLFNSSSSGTIPVSRLEPHVWTSEVVTRQQASDTIALKLKAPASQSNTAAECSKVTASAQPPKLSSRRMREMMSEMREKVAKNERLIREKSRQE